MRKKWIHLADFISLLNKVNHAVLYTCQHYSHNMEYILFNELNLNKPDYVIESTIPTKLSRNCYLEHSKSNKKIIEKTIMNGL
jgi:UDP-N-acetylglucosamine 2-epimerase